MRRKVNSLLDLRNTCQDEAAIREVDAELAQAAYRLFQLEA
jgi:hypothetical protein